ncbi:phage tail spike protein [Lacticaseibacillus rhamnosus]|uniref:phage tail spike protein n=1 Tax=Lacticaseibacillus rhamnosus TaxID=47715 RepID=UPI003B9971E7
MEYYFSDRKFNVMGVARTNGKGEWLVSADSEVKTTDDRPAIALTLTIPFKTEQEQVIDEMAAENNFVLYQDEEGNGHQMVIASITHDTLAHIHTVVCTDAGNDLMNEVVGAYKADKAHTIADYILMFTNDSGWEIGVNEFPTEVRTLTWTDEDTLLSRIKSVAKDFDAVLSFGFVFVGTTAVKRVINIRHEETSDSLISFEMNKDINNIVKTVDIYDMETSVKAYGATPDGSNDPINLIGYQWKDPNGQFVLDQYGFLHDTIAVQKYSRLLSNSNPNPTHSDWNRVKTFDSNSQATLLQAALADLKKYNHPNVNYEVDLVKVPYVPLNQTVHIVDENQNLFLSAKVLSVERSRAGNYTKLTLGDYANEQPNLYSALKDMAVKIENIPKAIQFYPWIRYADDDKGTNMSALPAGKKYMAIVPNAKSSVPSDNPADYAGKWALIQGKDGADGVPGAKGADGRTSYFHTAWANDVSGQSGFTVSGGDGKKYIGTYSDFTQADSTHPADYNWALFKGADGDVGPKGDQGLPGAKGADGRTAYAHFAYANSQDGHAEFSTTDSNRKYIGFYSDFTSGDSMNPSDYSWSLIKGADGADGKEGVPGKPGADGKTSYFHIAYADSSDGKTNFSLDTPGSRKYIGSYIDFTQEDSTNPALYSWQLVQGPQGDQGIQGPVGADGKSSYMHIAYANSSDSERNMNNWVLSEPAKNAATITYKNGVNTIDYTGVADYEVFNFPIKAKKGQSFTFSFSWTQPDINSLDGTADGVPVSITDAPITSPQIGRNVIYLGVSKTNSKLFTISGTATADTTYVSINLGYLVDGVQWQFKASFQQDFSQDPGEHEYMGWYSDFTALDSNDPSFYGWSLIKGADGADGAPGRAGADGKTPYFHIAYANSSDGRTNFSLDTPSSRKYIGSYTDFTQADSTNPALYSWQLVQGPQGERGKQIFKSSYEDEPNISGNWWSDLSPAPSVDNPPKIGDTVITPSGNIFQITTVIIGGGGGGGTFGVGGVLGSIRGPQGPQGVPGSKDVPYTYIQLGTPASPKKGDLWWHGKTLNDATALQYYNGSTWIDQSIQQAVLSIKKLQSIEIDTATINSPDINAPFHHTALSDANKGKFSSGNTSMQYGHVNITGNVENDQGKADGHMLISDLGPSGFISRERTPDNAGDVQYANLQGGKLNLSTLVSDENAADKKYVFSTYKSTDNVTYFYSNTTPYHNIDFSSGYIYYTRRGNLVTVNFDLYAIANQYQYLRLADIRPGYQPYLKNKIVCACPSFSYAGESATMYSSTPGGGTVGWYGVISRGQGAYAGSVTYLTQDDYPTGDTYFD